MKWGLRSSRHNQREKQQRAQEKEHKHEQQEDKGNKSRAAFLSFSPLAWLSKLTAKNNAAAAKPKPAAPADKSAAVAATGGFPSCFFKGASASTSTSVSSRAASQSSLADSSPADQAPRRLSVGNDGDTAEAAAARQLYHRRRHYSVGGYRDLQTLRNLIPFSRAASPLPLPVPFVPAVMKTMIASKRIGRPEELETLLACYLSLNADEHHDCIVKVFRQVWLELNPASVAAVAPPRS
uniref:Transcription repressor n=1 Tax=Oryza punctata TaxID=4537 RepID=A0A0E0JIQ8_ORYPU